MPRVGHNFVKNESNKNYKIMIYFFNEKTPQGTNQTNRFLIILLFLVVE